MPFRPLALLGAVRWSVQSFRGCPPDDALKRAPKYSGPWSRRPFTDRWLSSSSITSSRCVVTLPTPPRRISCWFPATRKIRLLLGYSIWCHNLLSGLGILFVAMICVKRKYQTPLTAAASSSCVPSLWPVAFIHGVWVKGFMCVKYQG